MTFRKWLQSKMDDEGMTQTTLGESTGLHQSAISRIMSGEQGLRVEDAWNISHALKVPFEEVCFAYIQEVTK